MVAKCDLTSDGRFIPTPAAMIAKDLFTTILQRQEEPNDIPLVKRKFAYVFSLGGKVVHSIDTAEALANRNYVFDDLKPIERFKDTAKIGEYVELSTGEMVFRVE